MFSILLISNTSFGYGGIGVQIQGVVSEDKKFFNLVIATILPGGGASQSGLQVGDTISAVNGENTYNRFSTQEDFNYFISLLRGSPGSEVSITVYRKKDYWLFEGKSSETFNIVRYEMGNPYGNSNSNTQQSHSDFESELRSELERRKRLNPKTPEEMDSCANACQQRVEQLTQLCYGGLNCLGELFNQVLVCGHCCTNTGGFFTGKTTQQCLNEAFR
jgi:hypothetical protein